MNYKTIMKFSLIGFLLVMALFIFVPMAMSAEKVVEATIESIDTRLDKNGNEYTRIIVAETKSLQGVEYSTGTPAMCFGVLNTQGKQLTAGEIFKGIVSTREYNGRTSYTVVAFLP